MPGAEVKAMNHTENRQSSTKQRSSRVPLHRNKYYLAGEFFALYLLSPFILFFYRHDFGGFLIPVLLAVSGLCMLLLWKDPEFDRRQLAGFNGFLPWLKGLPLTFIPPAAGLAIVCAVFRYDLLFAFPRNNTMIWLLVMVLYPLLSVYPQELIYRTFFFHRYSLLFPTQTSRIIMSGLCFGLAHLFFANWIAPVLTALGGLLFARTYARSGSTLLVSLEHSLWGNFIFTIGLGWYFYAGAISG